MPTSSDNYSFYYAARVNSANPAGTYATIVTYTAIGKPIPPPPLTWKQISAGGSHVCGIASDDWAYCWGRNNSGQLGVDSSPYQEEYSPVAVSRGVIPAGVTFKQISAGNSAYGDGHTCAIASNDLAYCWGINSEGQIGDGSYNDSFVPVAVDTTDALTGLTMKQISAGYGFTCAIASNNQAYCWGSNTDYKLGLGSGVVWSYNTPQAVTGALSGVAVKQITTGGSEFGHGLGHACAILASNGQAYCWGSNAQSQLGIGIDGDIMMGLPFASTPQAVVGALSGVATEQISAARYDFTCAIMTSNGQAYCWGAGGDWLGLGPSGGFGSYNTPQAVTGALSGVAVKQITTGYSHACAILTSNGQAYCWGSGGGGQIGTGSTSSYDTPQAVVGALSGVAVKQITAGYGFTCAIASNNQAYCWGDNTYGQLGNFENFATSGSSEVPILVDTPGL